MPMPRINKRWKINDAVPVEIDQALGKYPAFFRQILFSRGIRDELQARAYLECSLELNNPMHLSGMQETIDRLVWAIRHNEKVAVYGDYDVDGVTATALLTQVLRRCGADAVHYIPNRFEEGYGLNVEALEYLASEGVNLVITVDCGIRSPREAERAEALGIDLIITDHHQPGDELPNAFAVICPKLDHATEVDKDIAGVGIAFKIAQALLRALPQNGHCAEDWLDLVALGTVADVAPLRGENRALVRHGLMRMRQGQRPGVASLAGVAGLKIHQLCAGDIAFMLGPRLNAAGRLDTALDSLKLLMSENSMETGLLAQHLDNQNRQRQELTRRMQEEAMGMARQAGEQDILFAFSTGFNSGIVGLTASRLVDSFYRPAVVGEQGSDFTRASCRSIPEFHITQALDACSDLLERHGGHALAAGFTVRNENLPALQERLQTIAAQQLGPQELRPVLRADLELPLFELRPDFLPYLDQLQPTGQENAEAVFVSRGLRVVRCKKVGGEGQHLRMTVTDGKITYDAIAFRQGHRAEEMPQQIDMMYVYERNEFNGRTSLQLNVRDFRLAGQADD
jgi:single-stranded-DNA-specific exonuclease